MGRKRIQTEGELGSLSMQGEIEMMVQILNWTDEQIFDSLKTRHGEMDRDKTIARIRIIRHNYRQEVKEKQALEASVGTGSLTDLDSIKDKKLERFDCGIDNIDLLWGFSEDKKSKGFPRGQVSLLGGSPGVGKTRLMISVCGSLTDPSGTDGSAVYWQNEFALEQFKSVAKGKIKKDANFMCGDIRSIKKQMDEMGKVEADLVVIDSIQMLDEVRNKNGVDRCIAAYKRYAMDKNCHVVVITQLNKKDQISGSRAVEHLVDSVFLAVRDREIGGFSICCTKNRWGMSGIKASFHHNASTVAPFGDIQYMEE